jgi:hypothetical protein
VRRSLAVCSLAVVLAGCGSSGDTRGSSHSPVRGTIEALWRGSGESVGLVSGTSDYAAGTLRVSFLVVGRDARPVSRLRARVIVARSLGSKPFLRTEARLEPIGPPGAHEAAAGNVTGIYVARLAIARPGRYLLLAQPIGGTKRIGALGYLAVKRDSATPAVGARAYPSRTPTIASAHGRLARITTATPPDRDLLRYSVAQSLAAHRPFVVVFATPQFCPSRTCGPVVDVVQAVSRRFRGRGIRFIHVEIYAGNDPARGFNEWVRQWHLPSEPWVFLVGADGRIKAKFEGSVSVAELAAAVRNRLT